jgi:hypothetical protein
MKDRVDGIVFVQAQVWPLFALGIYIFLIILGHDQRKFIVAYQKFVISVPQTAQRHDILLEWWPRDGYLHIHNGLANHAWLMSRIE